MVGLLNSNDVNEEIAALYDDFDPLKEWLVDPDSVQLQNPCDYISFSPELSGHQFCEIEIKQEGQILESSIDLTMEKVSLIEISDGLCGAEMSSKENVGGNDGEINCAKPGLEASKSDRSLPFEEGASERESKDGEGSMSVVFESEDEDSSSEESSSDESSSITKSVSSSEDEDIGVKKSDMETGEFEEGELREVDAHETDFLSDEEEEGPKGPIRSKHEVEDLPPVPKVDVSLEPHHQLLPVGAILSVMMNRVIVESSVRHNPLNEGSILWVTDTRSPLGLVDEIFGPVKNPFYVVRYNTEEEIPAGVEVGVSVSFVSEFASQILNDKDLYKKGYDASGDNDEEIDNDFDFSDDEKEAEYRNSLRQGKRVANNKIGMKQEIRTDRKRNTFMKPRIRYSDSQKQQTHVPISIDHPRPRNLVPQQPAAFNRQPGIRPGSWNSSGAANANLLDPSVIPEFPQAMQAANRLGNPSQQLNAGSAASSVMPEFPQPTQTRRFLGNSSQQLNADLAAPRRPEFPQAMPPVSFVGNSSQQLLSPPQATSWLPGFSPQIQNAGFQSGLQTQLQNQNLLLNNLVNMMAFQQQLQQLIPQQGNNLPWFGASSSLQPLGQNNFTPPPFISAPPTQGPGNEQIRGQGPRPPFIGATTPGLGNEQIRGQAPAHFAPYMQFNSGNSNSLNSNRDNSSSSHGRPFHRGGGRFFGRGGRQSNR